MPCLVRPEWLVPGAVELGLRGLDGGSGRTIMRTLKRRGGGSYFAEVAARGGDAD